MNLLAKLMGSKRRDVNTVSQMDNHGTSYHNLTASEYKSRLYRANVAHTLVDVRRPDEFATGHLIGSLNIPVQELAERMSEIPSDKPAVLYCRTGNRSGSAAQILHNAGYPDVYNIGGFSELAAQGIPVDAPIHE